MAQRRVLANTTPMSERLFGPFGTEKSVFDSGPKKLAKTVFDLLGGDDTGMDALAGPVGAVVGKPVRSAAQEVVETLGGQTVPKGIRAFHGSPHRFDRFDIGKIGEGEGQQAFGHGLYFSENPTVARSYRNALSGVEFEPIIKDGLSVEAQEAIDDVLHVGLGAMDTGFNQTGALSRMSNALMERRGVVLPQFVSKIDEAIEALRRGDVSFGGTPGGSLSEVNLGVRPDELLDLDKPLSQQPFLPSGSMDEIIGRVKSESRRPTLQETIAVNVQDPKFAGNVTGAGYLDNLSQQLGSPRLASETLRDAGIPGSQFLDQGSRGSGEGTRNFVMFDDDKIDIVKQLMVLLGFGAPAAAAVQQSADPARPSLASTR